MGAGVVVTIPWGHSPAGLILQHGFEAGLVGGLADWFAVTALFRHPLGIPIPHTALLPKNRDKITNALVHAIQSELLRKESILEKLNEAKLAERFITYAIEKLQGTDAPTQMATFIRHTIRSIKPETITSIIVPFISHLVSSKGPSALHKLLSNKISSPSFESALLDYAIHNGYLWLNNMENREWLGRMALNSLEKLPVNGLFGFALNTFVNMMNEERLGNLIQQFLFSICIQLQTEQHPARMQALRAMRTEIEKLVANAAEQSTLNRFLTELFSSLFGPKSPDQGIKYADAMRETFIPMIQSILRQFINSTENMNNINRWIQEQAAYLIEKNHGRIGELVKENIDKLNDRSLVKLMENQIGQDLQWIRVNGALCGFTIGIIIGFLRCCVIQ
jgi:uncharacterized membrane-anchored protein YjiN (DUF445 family)